MLTTGPYSDALCGVVTPRRRLEAGTYLLVVSTYGPWSGGGNAEAGVGWEVKGYSHGGKIFGWDKTIERDASDAIR